jgi:hypothetical protein
LFRSLASLTSFFFRALRLAARLLKLLLGLAKFLLQALQLALQVADQPSITSRRWQPAAQARAGP